MEERKKVSVLIPCYNAGELIKKCLDSIPVRDDVEIVLLDDCSTDDTMSYVWQYVKDQPKIRIFQHDKNKGISETVNNLYDVADGEYLYVLDDDDYLLPDWEKVIDQLDGTDMVFVDAITTKGIYYDKHDEANHNRCAAWLYFLRKGYLGNERRVKNVYGGDYELYLNLTSRVHTAKFTKICAYCYNYPREGSITWEREHGK